MIFVNLFPHRIWKDFGNEDHTFIGQGIYEEDWNKSRTEAELEEIVSSAGLKVTQEEFAEAFEQAKKNGKSSISNFREALREIRKREILSKQKNNK